LLREIPAAANRRDLPLIPRVGQEATAGEAVAGRVELQVAPDVHAPHRGTLDTPQVSVRYSRDGQVVHAAPEVTSALLPAASAVTPPFDADVVGGFWPRPMISVL